MTLPLRRLPYLVADGPVQMAADEVLLESAVDGIASLRFYGWPEATLSLGYFQPADDRLADPLLAGLPWVRRASGGSALVHHHEVTYAIAFPPGRAWQEPLGWPGGLHEIIRRALAGLGVDSRLCGPEDAGKHAPVLCFRHFTPGDLLIGPVKVVGSAQRKARGAVLQHGGILLARSPATASLPGIAEVTGLTLTAEQVATALTATLVRATGWELQNGDWTEEERGRREDLVREKYGAARWNERR